MIVLEHIIVLLAVVLVVTGLRAMVVLFKPYKTCGWCKDRRERPRPWNKGRCWFCRNARLRRRLGAKQVHKVKLSLAQAWDEWRSS